MRKLVVKSALSSVLLVIASVAMADFASTSKALNKATPEEAVQILNAAVASDEFDQWGPNIQNPVTAFLESPDQRHLLETRRVFAAWAAAEAAGSGKISTPQTPSNVAKEILSNPKFIRDDGRHSNNWLERALENLSKLFKRDEPQAKPKPLTGSGINLGWITPVAWVLLAVAVAAGLYFALKNVKFTRRRKARTGGLLEDDEPDRSADEWVLTADGLESQGKFREAVRCLYLACLARMDEANIVRFIRSETNWEHLHRLSQSPTKPPALEFQEPTQRFDVIWYGFQVKGKVDVDYFREVYRSVSQMAQERSS